MSATSPRDTTSAPGPQGKNRGLGRHAPHPHKGTDWRKRENLMERPAADQIALETEQRYVAARAKVAELIEDGKENDWARIEAEAEPAVYALAGSLIRDLAGRTGERDLRLAIAAFMTSDRNHERRAGTVTRDLLRTAARRVAHAQRGWAPFYPSQTSRRLPTVLRIERQLEETGYPLDVQALELHLEVRSPTVARALRDLRLARVAKGRYALRRWGLPEYKNIETSLMQLIEVAGGRIELETAVRVIARRHDLRAESIRMKANGVAVKIEDGYVVRRG